MRVEMKVYMSHTDAEVIRLAAQEERIPVSQFMREAAMHWAQAVLGDVLMHPGPGHVSAQAIRETIPTLAKSLGVLKGQEELPYADAVKVGVE